MPCASHQPGRTADCEKEEKSCFLTKLSFEILVSAYFQFLEIRSLLGLELPQNKGIC